MTCRCGRERATATDLERFRATVPTDHAYAMAPMTWVWAITFRRLP